MSLINCKECGHKVSDSAKACPSCGVKLRPKTTAFTKAATICLVMIFGVAAFTGDGETKVAAACPALDPVTLKLPEYLSEAQPDFMAKAEKLRSSGVCVVEGNWGASHKKFYFAAFNLGDKKPYFIRLTREELKL